MHQMIENSSATHHNDMYNVRILLECKHILSFYCEQETAMKIIGEDEPPPRYCQQGCSADKQRIVKIDLENCMSHGLIGKTFYLNPPASDKVSHANHFLNLWKVALRNTITNYFISNAPKHYLCNLCHQAVPEEDECDCVYQYGGG